MTAPALPGYVVGATLGRGAMGTVHLARRADWAGRVVAVKRVRHAGAGLAGTLRHEAEVLAALDHPHIVRILDLVPDGDGVAIAMQYAPGGSLPDLLARRGPLSPGEVVAVAAPVADALASAHRRGVLHCDVKPANVLFTSDGEPLLSDFGLARGLVAAGADVTGTFTGTAEYADPTVAAGAPPDGRSDVYGLGAVCYELLAGRPPFAGATPEAVLDAALAGPPVPLGTAATAAPPGLVQAVERAMARDPAERFADAAAFAAALRSAVAPTPVRMGDEPALPTPPPACVAPAAPPVPTGPGERRPTRRFGTRPPRLPQTPVPAATAPRSRRTFAMGAGLALIAGVAASALLTSADHPGRRPLPTGPSVALAARSCPDVAGSLRADVDGDGCPSAVSWRGDVAGVEGRRYELGRPGDALLVGNWDCRGAGTPALYRPSTGEVFLFDDWAEAGSALVARDGGRFPPEGVPSVVRDADGCDRVTVDRAAPVPPPPPG